MSDRHPPAMLIADAPGLDFLNSIATPVDVAVDWIADGDGLLRWLAQSGMVPADVLDRLKAQAQPGELDRVAAQARDLRRWFAEFVRGHMGRPLTADALKKLAPLNALLARDDKVSRLVTNMEGMGPALELRTERRWHGAESLLLPVAEALANLVCRQDFTYVKACEGPACTLLFADHTGRRVRRWCSMAACGNRAKQAAHRNRARTRTDADMGPD